MRPTGKQYKALQDALIDAFPTVEALAQMVRIGLNENLAAIAGGSSLGATAFNLLQWGEAQGRLEELVRAAREANPGNPALRDAAVGLLGEAAGAAPAHAAHAPAAAARPAPSLRELRETLARLYTSPAEITRVASDAGLALSRIDFGGAATIVWHNVLSEASKQGLLGAIIQVAREDYAANGDLARAAAAFGGEAGALPRASAPGMESTAPAPSGVQMYEALTRLLPAQFDEVVFRSGLPAHHLSSASAPLATRARELVQAAEVASSLAALEAAVRKVVGR